MKKICAILILMSLTQVSFSQSEDVINTRKYWKFRNSFRRDFIKIGDAAGEGIPMISRQPSGCIDNVTEFYDHKFGNLKWGDSMIEHGHYIGFLATEYKLLKNNDQDVTAVLNELYYALNAINRVDRDAEPIITTLNDDLPFQPQNLNGFYLRSDVPEDFNLKWIDEPIQARCVETEIYGNNNAGKLNGLIDGTQYKTYSSTNSFSVPSLDQMTSLLVGLSVCYELLEDELYVQPTPADEIMNMRNEVQQITHRLVSYAKDHNWYLLNERGWPVGNGGGNLIFTIVVQRISRRLAMKMMKTLYL
jgi:hypothetical protein